MDGYFEDINKGLQPTTTITLPLTTTFTPAPGCSSSWTYVQLTSTLTSFSIDGGLVQEFKDSLPDRDCFPSGHLIHWDIGTAQVYSPGFCPVGYTVDAASVEGTTTTEICCLEYVTQQVFLTRRLQFTIANNEANTIETLNLFLKPPDVEVPFLMGQ